MRPTILLANSLHKWRNAFFPVFLINTDQMQSQFSVLQVAKCGYKQH